MRGKGLAEEQNSTLEIISNISILTLVASPLLNWMKPSQFPPGLWTTGVQAHRTADMNEYTSFYSGSGDSPPSLTPTKARLI